MSKKITMQQIADHLNVSKFVVSRALSGKDGVSDETRERVIKAATQLGYLYQRSLQVAKKTNYSNQLNDAKVDQTKTTVLVMVPNHPFHQDYSYYWGKILDGISSELKRENLGMLVVTNHNIEYFWQIINPAKLYGIIGVGFISNQLLLELKSFNVPMVLVDHEDPVVPFDSIFTDNIKCSKRMTNYMIGLGHKRFQFIGDIHNSGSFAERWLGYRVSLEENNIPHEQNPEFFNIESVSGEQLTLEVESRLERMIDDPEFPTAFICANDAIAISTITALRRLGKQVPEECSVTGFDDIEEATTFEPSITTVRVAKETLGIRAVDMLLWRLEHPDSPFEKLLIHGDLAIRKSVVPMNKRVM